MKHALAASLAAVALLFGSGAAPAPAADAPKPVVVHITMFKFIPATVTVPAGTTITFVNDDEEPHTVTATNKSFDSEAMDSHQSWKHAFAKSGTFTYFCELHPYMKGTIVVKGTP
jgi:plastocyanin